jgi:hypothetical protein
MINNSLKFEPLDKSFIVIEGTWDIGTISCEDGIYTFQPTLYHKYNADSLLIISRYLNKLNKQGLDILRDLPIKDVDMECRYCHHTKAMHTKEGLCRWGFCKCTTFYPTPYRVDAILDVASQRLKGNGD